MDVGEHTRIGGISLLTPRRAADVQRTLLAGRISIATTLGFGVTVTPADVVGRLPVGAAGLGTVVAPTRLFGAACTVATRSVRTARVVSILRHLATHEKVSALDACKRVMLDGLNRAQWSLRIGP